MTHRTSRRTHARLLAALALAAVTATVTATAAFATPAARSTHPVVWTWDPTTPVGTSTLVRTDASLSATIQSSGIPAGQAVTLWFIVWWVAAGSPAALRPASAADSRSATPAAPASSRLACRAERSG